MFDYERYDHTYCRLTRDGEEMPTRKRSYSASWETSSDTEVPSIRGIVVENDSTNKREPVIIVRTKKPRKPEKSVVATKPDKLPEAVETVVSVSAANQNVATGTVITAPNSLIKKDTTAEKTETKAKKAAVNGNPATKATGDSSKPKAKRQYNKKKISNKSQDSNKSTNSTDPEEETEAAVVSVSQSGRVRKLTDKAASLQKKKRIRKPKTSETTDNRTESSNVGDENQTPVDTLKVVVEDKQPKAEVDTSKKIGQETAKEKSKRENARQTKADIKPSEKKTKGTANKRKPTTQSKAKAAPVKTKGNKKAKSTKPIKQSTSKVKQKLIVVSKPSPKQRRAAAARAAETNKSLPAARIDLDNIVQGSRRRHK